MTEFTKEIYDELIAAVDALPKEAIEAAKKEVTRKGYDTTGYQYQYLVNVLNEVLGPAAWDMSFEIVNSASGKWSNGKEWNEVSVSMDVTILGAHRKGAGGHKSDMYGDALKGAITNAFKKTLSFFGVGKKAYEGVLDEDYQPLPEAPVQKQATPLRDDPTDDIQYAPLSKTHEIDGKKTCHTCGKVFEPKAGTESYAKDCYNCYLAKKK